MLDKDEVLTCDNCGSHSVTVTEVNQPKPVEVSMQEYVRRMTNPSQVHHDIFLIPRTQHLRLQCGECYHTVEFKYNPAGAQYT